MKIGTAPHRKGGIKMKTINILDAPVHENPHGIDARKVYDTQHAQAVVITLEPGQQLKRHITPVDAIFFVLEGRGIVEVGDEKEEVGPNTLIDSPAKIPHCWYNEGDSTLRVLVIKVPRQEEPSKML
jgi:mannose-6-phosphate isomerase-like protein (cupin superfamily)